MPNPWMDPILKVKEKSEKQKVRQKGVAGVWRLAIDGA